MIHKFKGISIDEKDPFHHDKLERDIIVKNLTKIISSLQEPFVFEINSPWGTGKTTFIKMWNQFLINKGLMKHTLDKNQAVKWCVEFLNNGEIEKDKIENIVKKFENPYEKIIEEIDRFK